jgi:hypothetical protein
LRIVRATWCTGSTPCELIVEQVVQLDPQWDRRATAISPDRSGDTCCVCTAATRSKARSVPLRGDALALPKRAGPMTSREPQAAVSARAITVSHQRQQGRVLARHLCGMHGVQSCSPPPRGALESIPPTGSISLVVPHGLL